MPNAPVITPTTRLSSTMRSAAGKPGNSVYGTGAPPSTDTCTCDGSGAPSTRSVGVSVNQPLSPIGPSAIAMNVGPSPLTA